MNTAFNSDSLGVYRGGVDIPKQIGRGRWLNRLANYQKSKPYRHLHPPGCTRMLDDILIVKLSD